MKSIYKLTYPALFIFSALVFLGHYVVSGQAVYGDGLGYYAHLHSWVFDNDWNNANEFRHLYSPENNNVDNPRFSGDVQNVSIVNKDKRQNYFGSGMAFVLLPFYVLAHILATIGHLVGFQFHPNGYSDIYQILTGIGAIFYTVVGLWFLEKLVRKFTKDNFVARAATVGLYLSTNLIYYGSYNVITSHFSSFFLVTTFFYILILFSENSRKTFLLGLVGGLATVNRQQDGFLVILWLIYLFEINRSNVNFISLQKSMKQFVIYFAGFLTTLSLLLVQLHSNYKSLSGLSDNAYVKVFIRTFDGSKKVNILGSLIDSMNGLFIKSPIFIPVFIYYFYLLYKKKVNIYYNLAFIFFLGQYLIITLERGWEAAAYGGRMYISSFIFLGLILGELIKTVKNEYGSKLVVIILSVFVLVNFYSIIRFTLYEKQATLGRKGIEEYTIKRIERIIGPRPEL